MDTIYLTISTISQKYYIGVVNKGSAVRTVKQTNGIYIIIWAEILLHVGDATGAHHTMSAWMHDVMFERLLHTHETMSAK